MKKLMVSPLVLLFLAGSAWADCVDGVRQLNPSERRIFDEVATAIVAALPQAPESWKLSQPIKVLEPAPCTSTRTGAFSIGTALMYRYLNPPKRRVYAEEAEIKKLQDEIEALQRTPDDVRKQVNEVMAQQSEKRRASRAAEQAGNKEEAIKLRKEADEISKGADKLRADYLQSVDPQVKQRKARISELTVKMPSYSTEVSVSVVVNERKAVPTAGKSLNEDVYVWGLTAAAKDGVNVQNVVLKIAGWPDYREFIVGKIDLSKLSGLVK